MLFLTHLIGLFALVQPLKEKQLKDFAGSFQLLSVAHYKNRPEIVTKYGPEVLGNYDLIQIQFEKGNRYRDSYDSLISWVVQAKSSSEQKAILDSLDHSSPSVFAELIARIQLSRFPQSFTDTLNGRVEEVFGERCELDTLFRVNSILPISFKKKVDLENRLAKELEIEFKSAQNQGADALAVFAARFPGAMTSEINSSLSFAQIDETNALLRSGDKAGLISLYKQMGASPSRNQVAQRLEKIMYSDWQSARIHDEEIRAAKDYLEVFKDEKKKTKKYKEVESWLYYNSSPVPVVRTASATPAGASSAVVTPGAVQPEAPPTVTLPNEPVLGSGAHVSYEYPEQPQ